MTDRNKSYLVVGLGVSGMSVVRYLARVGAAFEVLENSVEKLQNLMKKEALLKDIKCHTSALNLELLSRFDYVVVSPGMSVRTDMFKAALKAGVEVIGDVELFAREVDKPVFAVTGSNGKSTVVSMAGELLKASGIKTAVVGNVGAACLDSLNDKSIDAYVLELSSFQLETTFSLQPHVSSVLNISADHLDRYDDIEDYAEVKRRIYNNARHVVFNADDKLTRPANLPNYDSCMSFSSSAVESDWSVKASGGAPVLSGESAEISATDVKVAGSHNYANALAAMAMISIFVNADKASMSRFFTEGFSNFTGLPHRTRLVCEAGCVSWINDSKGTNVGATVSAITGMSSPVVLIAGGRGKNSDYQPLREAVAKFCTAVVLIGEDADNIAESLADVVPVYRETSMADAVRRSAAISRPGDCVLLSPACSSFDMFKNFEERGAVFESEVKKLCA